MGGWDDRDDDKAEEPGPSGNLPVPWEQDDYSAAPNDTPPRPRHDAFTPARRATFLKHLAKYGCLTDAARRTGVSTRTVYNHQDKDAAFTRDCALAARLAGGRLELTAFERAVDGVPQPFACGGEVHMRTRYSDSLLRLLLQGTNPRKYGAHPGFTRKRLLASERKRLKQELRAEMRPRSLKEVSASVLAKLAAFDRQHEETKRAAGWMRDEQGNWIPPGWIRAGQADPEEGGSKGDETPHDSMCKSCKS